MSMSAMVRVVFGLILAVWAGAGPAAAQQTVNICNQILGNTGTPSCQAVNGLLTTNLSGTIAVSNTFQSIQVATQRSGCLVQNNGSHNMYVFFGPIASATEGTSVLITPNGSGPSAVSCNSGMGVLKDQISVTGTSGDAFYAGVQ